MSDRQFFRMQDLLIRSQFRELTDEELSEFHVLWTLFNKEEAN
jgi:hypothetical protein